jgi:hypothetical protein
MTIERRNASLLVNGSVNTFRGKLTRARRAEFYVVSHTLVATQRCCKYISAAVNQYATIEEAVFTVGPSQAARIRVESSEFAVDRIIENKLQERN